MKRLFFCVLAYLVCVISSLAMDTEQRIFNHNFRTLKVANADAFMAPPVMRLATDDRIIISFDEIAEGNSYLRYRLIHCNADWQPSALVESEYLPSFNEEDVNDYAFSQNTFIHYVNYRIEIPNERMNPLVSGNYLLQVYPEFEQDDIILQARFYVVEPGVYVRGQAFSQTDRGVNDIYQQLNLTIDTGEFPIRDPFNDIRMVVLQNNREDSKRFIDHPQRMSGKSIVYEHMPDLIFPAGNEYRRFETVRADYPGLGIDSVRFIGNNYHAWVHQDRGRADSEYLYDRTQNGRFLIRDFYSTDSDLGADYVTVHFSLDFPEVVDADIYVEGEMTGNDYSHINRMEYNHNTRLYELQMPLKQGSYNYQYVARKKGNPAALAVPALIEGDKYETKNEYLVLVYQHQPGTRADRLIGYNVINYEF